jgi:uncharacterized membrane protein
MTTRTLTEEEIKANGQELASVVIQIQEARGELKVVGGQIRQRIAALEERRNELAQSLQSGQAEVDQQGAIDFYVEGRP